MRTIEEKKLEVSYLTEYKKLILWYFNVVNRKLGGYVDIKDFANTLKNDVESGKIVYKTEKGIKGRITKYVTKLTLSMAQDKLMEVNGFDILNRSYTYTPVYKRFVQKRLDILMGDLN